LATQVTIQAKVIDVVDGDTIYVKINERVKLLRVTGADAPDLGQPKYDLAVEFMRKSLLDKDVLVHYSTYGIWDLDGVPLVTISDGDTDVGLRLIENGMAWYDEAHQFYLSKTTADLYKTKCKEARDNKIGLWGDRSPEKPSDYRHRLRIEERKRLAAKKP
jgi:micrococcal nuclease